MNLRGLDSLVEVFTDLRLNSNYLCSSLKSPVLELSMIIKLRKIRIKVFLLIFLNGLSDISLFLFDAHVRVLNIITFLIKSEIRHNKIFDKSTLSLEEYFDVRMAYH